MKAQRKRYLLRLDMSRLINLTSIIAIFLFSSCAWATQNAASCSQADVQAAVDAASDGETVNIPACDETAWTSEVDVPNDKNLIIIGAGKASTIIQRDDYIIDLNSTTTRLTGFKFVDGKVRAGGSGWRIDHCHFYSASDFKTGVEANGLSPTTQPYGLVDNCDFTNSHVAIGHTTLLNHNAWADALNLGTSEAVYVEDCTFDGGINAVDSNYGGKYVFRYNTLTDVYIEAHSLQSTSRAVRKWEIYRNTIQQVTAGEYMPFRLRGGTGVVFENVITGTWTNYNIALDNRRSCEDLGDGELCDGTSPWDGNTGEGDEAGYPCRDQIGRSIDNPVWVVGEAYTQALDSAYEWDNCKVLGCSDGDANDIDFLVLTTECTTNSYHIQSGRDFFQDTERPNYTPYTYPHPLRWSDPVAGINIGSGTSTFTPGTGSHTFTPN